ncbi:hypothetical protein ACJJTC_005154 [Scirpophaga incertulas]
MGLARERQRGGNCLPLAGGRAGELSELGTLKREKAETSSESSDDEKKVESVSKSSLALAQARSSRVENIPEVAENEFVCDNDLGKWRFSNEHLPAFSLMSLHPNIMLSMTLTDFQENCKAFTNFYELAIERHETELWYKLWKDKGIPNEELEKIDFTDTLKEAKTFFPAIKKAILILLAQPCTTANIERSFSTLRRIKTWLRSTMSENRLNGLYMLSVHRKMLQEKKDEVIKKVLNRFCEQPRRLMFK